MATREEKIKKINEELEKLTDDELEKIAGGIFFAKEILSYKNKSETEKFSKPDNDTTRFYARM